MCPLPSNILVIKFCWPVLSNAINCNVQSVFLVIPNTQKKRKHLDQILRWHTTSNEIILIMWMHINKESPIELILKPICPLD